MASVILNGTPGTTWTNDTGKVRYQFHVNWRNTCGTCAQFDMAIGPLWPIPLHPGCRCENRPVWPGESSAPFVDFRRIVDDLPPGQKWKVVGKANLILIERGVVSWSDVVTPSRVRDLREVVSLKKLGVDRMIRAGVRADVAGRAYATVHTPAHELALARQKELVGKIRAKGALDTAIRRGFGERVAVRVGIGGGPSGPSSMPGAIRRPKTPTGPIGGNVATIHPDVAARLGIVARPPAASLGLAFTPSRPAVDQRMPTVPIVVARLDEGWARDVKYYIPSGGGGDPQKKYAAAVAFVRRAMGDGTPVEMPRVTVDEDGTVSFTDGRHRFAALRDLGASSVPVSVDPLQARRARRLFGLKRPPRSVRSPARPR